MSEKKYQVLGLMSGTSLDGLDIAGCSFEKKNANWNFVVHKTLTLPYPEYWKNELRNAHQLEGFSLVELDKSFGKYMGKQINEFLTGSSVVYNLIASHGHTIYHQPEKRITFQIGDGNAIAAETGINTIFNFRSLDVALGGQGAPLVPIGDKLLFNSYDFCLNLGGFSNISYDYKNQRIAFDPSPANLPINYLMSRLNKTYDKDGETGRTGKIDKNLLNKLNGLSYYKQRAPKSLGREWIENNFIPILDSCNIAIEDKLRTVYEHLAIQISKPMENFQTGKLLITGGGAHNTFLIERLRVHTKHQVIIPSKEIIDFKEAIIFAFLGVLRYRNEVNCLASVTGARKDSSGGSIVMIHSRKGK